MEKWGIRFGKVVPKVKPKDVLKTWNIVAGDIVQVISGGCKGQQGKVIHVRRRENRVRIEGINIARKHVPDPESPTGKTVYNIEQGIHISNVALIDPVTKLPTRIALGYGEENTGRGRLRISKRSGAEIPKPQIAVRERKVGPHDTPPEEATRRTFVPSLAKAPVPSDCML